MKNVLAWLLFLLVLPVFNISYAMDASQITGNVPDAKMFDVFLQRDLNAYFKQEMSEDVTVSYTPLRDGPTQSGVAYPKYYLWVKVNASKKLVNEGAVRVAAVNGNHFEVTDFLPKTQIISHPEAIGYIFPAALVPKIKGYAGIK